MGESQNGTDQTVSENSPTQSLIEILNRSMNKKKTADFPISNDADHSSEDHEESNGQSSGKDHQKNQINTR